MSRTYRRFLSSFIVVVTVCLPRLQSQINVSDEGPSDSPLIQAIWMRNVPRAREIVASGVNLDTLDRYGCAPLAESISRGLSDFAEELVSAGADPNYAEGDGTTPLMQAGWNCDTRMAKLLLQHGAALEAVNRDGETALTMSAQACRKAETTEFLIASGANVNVRNKLGYTPLMLAADQGSVMVVKALLRAGADIHAKNGEGETARSLACNREVGREKGHDQACAILRRAKNAGVAISRNK
jgi:uncharacterized protein